MARPDGTVTEFRALPTHALQPMTLPSPFATQPPASETETLSDTSTGNDKPPRRKDWAKYGGLGGVYLVSSLVLWWSVLPHAGTVTTCGCGDGALTLWVIRWPAYALSHGLNPFYSAKLFVPRGINMAPNSLGLGIGMAPVTWLFGPIASLNVIDVVSPAASALAMFWLLRRWVAWEPAAFVGGLFFGFSPFVLTSLALAHPNFGLLAPVPLIIGCLDDLFFRRRHRSWKVGIALGVVVAVEFFISVEVLLLLLLFAVFSVVAIGVWALVTRPRIVPEQLLLAAARGLAAAAGVAIVLLVYPLWFFFRGPAHLTGRAWPDSPAGTVTNSPSAFVNGFISQPLTEIMHQFGGYQGPPLPLLCYLGVGIIAVVAVGSAIWWRDALVRLFFLLGVVAALLSLGVSTSHWTPWRPFTHLPVLNNVVPVNISAIVNTCVAVVLAVVVDRSHASMLRRRVSGAAGLLGVSVAAIAMVPIVVALWPNIPMTVRPVVVPRWFTVAAPGLGAHAVVLPYPAALGGIQSSMAWQAMEGMTFSMVGGGGPGIAPSRAGPERPGFEVLARASLPLSAAPLPTAANLEAIRQALAGWGVTTIVVPDQPGMPSYNQGRPVPYAVGLFSAALGQAPVFKAKAWVWDDVKAAGPPVSISAAQFDKCTTVVGGTIPNGATAASCVLGTR
jgi:hypothetical protein